MLEIKITDTSIAVSYKDNDNKTDNYVSRFYVNKSITDYTDRLSKIIESCLKNDTKNLIKLVEELA